MRLHYGRKVGKRSHVGVSIDPAKEGKGCLYLLFVWPLQMIYYIVVYPFVWITKKLMQGKVWAKWVVGGFAALAVVGGVLGLLGGDDEPTRETPEDDSVVAIVAEQTPATLPVITPVPTSAPTPEPTPTPVPTEEPEPTPKAGIKAYVDADELNLRAEPSRDSEIIGEYTEGQALEIVGESGEWYEVDIDGKTGYMVQEYITKGEYKPREEEPAREQESETETSGETVYWAQSGDKYHSRKGCRSLQDSDVLYEGTIQDALDFGRIGPCGICY